MVYNDLGGDAHWVLRDCVNAGLFATFASGASIVSNNSRTLSSNSVKAIIVNTLLYATTNYSQDFKDVIGDARVGRRTVPIAFPAIARVLLMPLLICWSIGLALVWQLGLSLSVPFIAYATAIGCRYLVCKGEVQDKKSAQLFVVSVTRFVQLTVQNLIYPLRDGWQLLISSQLIVVFLTWGSVSWLDSDGT